MNKIIKNIIWTIKVEANFFKKNNQIQEQSFNFQDWSQSMIQKTFNHKYM